MPEHNFTFGTHGRLLLIDYSYTDNKFVDVWVQSLTPLSMEFPWSYTFKDVREDWYSFNLQPTTVWQRLGQLHVGTDGEKLIIHIGDTGTTALDGPTDFEISIAGYIPPVEEEEGPPLPKHVRVYHEGAWKKAIAYVNVDGVWTEVTPMVKTTDGWKEVY